VRIDGHAGALGAIHHRPFPMASAESHQRTSLPFVPNRER
jgi:hypothetical protein